MLLDDCRRTGELPACGNLRCKDESAGEPEQSQSLFRREWGHVWAQYFNDAHHGSQLPLAKLRSIDQLRRGIAELPTLSIRSAAAKGDEQHRPAIGSTGCVLQHRPLGTGRFWIARGHDGSCCNFTGAVQLRTSSSVACSGRCDRKPRPRRAGPAQHGALVAVAFLFLGRTTSHPLNGNVRAVTPEGVAGRFAKAACLNAAFLRSRWRPCRS